MLFGETPSLQAAGEAEVKKSIKRINRLVVFIKIKELTDQIT